MPTKRKTMTDEERAEVKCKRIAHLSKPGKTNNPNGRPVGRINFTKLIKARLRQVDKDDPNGGTLADNCADDFIKLFRKGNQTAIREMMGRIDGPLPTAVDLTSAGKQLQAVTVIRVHSTEEPSSDSSPDE